MKILCICGRGNSRSVALAWILKDFYGHDAIAMGIEVAGEETQKMLMVWAETIILVDKSFVDRIPKRYQKKLKVWDVGGDRFFRGFEPELLEMYQSYLTKDGGFGVANRPYV